MVLPEVKQVSGARGGGRGMRNAHTHTVAESSGETGASENACVMCRLGRSDLTRLDSFAFLLPCAALHARHFQVREIIYF